MTVILIFDHSQIRSKLRFPRCALIWVPRRPKDALIWMLRRPSSTPGDQRHARRLTKSRNEYLDVNIVCYDERTAIWRGHPKVGPNEITLYKHKQSIRIKPDFNCEFDICVSPINVHRRDHSR